MDLRSYIRDHLSGIRGVRSETPPVTTATAGLGDRGARVITPGSSTRAPMPLQIGGLFGSDNTTSVAAPPGLLDVLATILAGRQEGPPRGVPVDPNNPYIVRAHASPPMDLGPAVNATRDPHYEQPSPPNDFPVPNDNWMFRPEDMVQFEDGSWGFPYMNNWNRPY